MIDGVSSKYFLVEADILPDIFIKVVQAKQLLETGEAATVAEATNKLGMSRSAYYKYKDSISPFQDLKRGRMISLHVTLRHKMGVLSAVLAVFANTGANILTINQSIPMGGTAFVTISAETADMSITADALMDSIRAISGVKKAEVTAG
jgi:chorismate mutase